MMLGIEGRGGASIVADPRWVFVATWRAVRRVEKATGEVATLHGEPTGGIVPGAIAADDEAVYFVVRGACRDEWARAAECASIRAVRKLGGAAPRVVVLAQGKDAPELLAVANGYVYFAAKNHVFRAKSAGGAVENAADAGESVRGLAVDGESVYYNDGARLVARTAGEPPRVLGRTDDEGRVAVAFDGAAIYWIAGGKVWRRAKTGAAVEVVGEARSANAHLRADSAGIAWTEPQDRTVALKPSGRQVARVRFSGERPDDLALDERFAFATTIDVKDGSMRVFRTER
jgi:hypothetical protein